MFRNKSNRWSAAAVLALLAFTSLALMAAGQSSQAPSPQSAGPAQPAPRQARAADVGKGVAEAPAKRMVANTAPAREVVNPKVPPGLVRWHENFQTACDAARKSGKPVLLFHMMGKLEDQFC